MQLWSLISWCLCFSRWFKIIVSFFFFFGCLVASNSYMSYCWMSYFLGEFLSCFFILIGLLINYFYSNGNFSFPLQFPKVPSSFISCAWFMSGEYSTTYVWSCPDIKKVDDFYFYPWKVESKMKSVNSLWISVSFSNILSIYDLKLLSIHMI